jgi:hypothetical protein
MIMLTVRVLILPLLYLAFALASLAHAEALDTFTWISEQDQPQLWNKILASFHFELQPDDPKKTAPTVPYLYKRIARIGCCRSSCIVLIENREKGDDDPDEYFYRTFSYDLSRQVKKQLNTDIVFWAWSFFAMTSFDPNTTDVVFKYFSCRECEKTELLSSFSYDKKSASWTVRVWPTDDPHILIGSDDQYGDGGIYHYDCLHSLRDVDGDGFADITVRCRITEDSFEGGKVRLLKDYTRFYRVKQGSPKRTEVRGKKETKKIRNVLCEGNRANALCRD